MVLLRVAESSRQRKCRNLLVSGCSVDVAAGFLSGPFRIQGVRDFVLGCIDFFSDLFCRAFLRTARQCKSCSKGDDSGKEYAQATCSLPVISCSGHSPMSPFEPVLGATPVPQRAFVMHQHAPDTFQAPDSRQLESLLFLRGAAPFLFSPTKHLGLGRRLLVHAMVAVQSLLSCPKGGFWLHRKTTMRVLRSRGAGRRRQCPPRYRRRVPKR